ncbi:DeoR/GlpR family DNA-binding transcription regulator [Planctomicrobium sp. SH664]|uniref:DeoR/GlpR family DNA-binding transcription regulator n=1 Tax=Planctomicrobium sp. SH664 TaxID=3448125 RepID=UPI003F5B6BDC
MLTHERHQKILKYLQKRPSTSVLQLQEQLGVSRSTLRRDLVELAEQGEIVRVHGGVVHRDYLAGEPSYDRRGREALAAKRLIAEAAASLVPPNSTVYLDAGSTCVELGRRLALRDDLKLFTHSVRLLMEIHDAAAQITCVGGEYRAVSQALVGGLGLKWLDQLRCQFAFLGASGLSVADGVSTTEITEAGMKQKIIERCDSTIILADSRKWETPAAVQFAPWEQVDTFITEELENRSALSTLKDSGTTVLIAR